MSTPQKLRGGKPSELTNLKTVWRGLSEEARDYWRALFVSSTAQADIRAQLRVKLKINLGYDKQLNAFREWLDRQDAMEAEAEAMQDDERNFTAQYGDSLTKDQIRELVLGASYRRSLATGNFADGRATAKLDLAIETARFQAKLDAEKLQLAKDAEARKREEFSLDRQKFEFDASAECLKRLPDLKAVSDAPRLTPEEKQAAIREILFPKTTTK